MTFSVTGNTIDVSVNYNFQSICLGALSFNTHIGTFPPLSGGTYNVVVKSYASGTLQDTWPTQTMVVTSCGPEASFDVLPSPICLGDSVFATNTSQGSTIYTWLYNGIVVSTSMDQAFLPTTTGSADITLIASDGSSFDTATTTINVLAAAPSMSLGNDTAICGYDSISISGGTGFSVINWSTGDSSESIMVGAGVYSLSVSNSESCVASDTINVTEVEVPELEMEEPAAVNCDAATISANTGFAAYAWSNGGTNQSTDVTVSGTYYVTVATNEGCTREDSVSVMVYNSPLVDIGNDTTFCKTPAWQWTLNTPLSGTRLWSDGSSSNVLTVFGTPGVYWLELTDSNGCVGTDTIELKEKNCATGIEEGGVGAKLTLYPNPAKDRMVLESSSIVRAIGIYDLTGALLLTQPINAYRSELVLEGLPAGMYYLTAKTEEGPISEKIQIYR
ncbi:MAG: hypothetical protein Salg2KO_04030 [Salibacteraceae bacterium]